MPHTPPPGATGAYFAWPFPIAPLCSGLPTPGPASRNFYAVSDLAGPPGSAQFLLQPFTVPANSGKVTLSFDMFVNDWWGFVAVDPSGLDWTSGGTMLPNEHGRVDLLVPAPVGGLLTTLPADIIQNLYPPGADGPPFIFPHPYTNYSFDLSGVVDTVNGGTYILRFADVENMMFFNLGVDNVRVETSEPSSALFLLSALPFAGLLRRRK